MKERMSKQLRPICIHLLAKSSKLAPKQFWGSISSSNLLYSHYIMHCKPHFTGDALHSSHNRIWTFLLLLKFSSILSSSSRIHPISSGFIFFEVYRSRPWSLLASGTKESRFPVSHWGEIFELRFALFSMIWWIISYPWCISWPDK